MYCQEEAACLLFLDALNLLHVPLLGIQLSFHGRGGCLHLCVDCCLLQKRQRGILRSAEDVYPYRLWQI